jgi:O-antigen/teichoic acid export membrane protein
MKGGLSRIFARSISVRRNIFANLAGNTVTALTTIICAPIYIHLLGIESYGLIGVYLTLQTLSIFLDMGFSTAINREIARLSVEPDKAQTMRDLTHSLEVIYWLFGAVIFVGLAFLAPVIANNWLHFTTLNPSVGEQAIRMAGLAIGLRWPLTLYSGGLMGLQRQVSLNWILTLSGVVQSFGAAAALWLVEPTITVFFIWQIIMAAVPSIWARWSLWNCLPAGNGPGKFSPDVLLSVWRFTTGAAALSVTAMLLNQVDKVVLSKMVSLETFGYYNLAGVAANAIYRLVGPVFSAVFPFFSGLVNANDVKRLAQSYHRACAVVSVLIGPAAALGTLFSGTILLIWTRNASTAVATHVIMSLLVAGSAFNAVIYIPYAMQLAYGWTTLGVSMNLLGLVGAATLLPVMISSHGATGAAAAKLIISGVIFAISPYIMHCRVLQEERRRWYLADVAKPFVVAFALTGLATLVPIQNQSRVIIGVFLAGVFVVTSAVTAIAEGEVRTVALSYLGNRFGFPKSIVRESPVPVNR